MKREKIERFDVRAAIIRQAAATDRPTEIRCAAADFRGFGGLGAGMPKAMRVS
jgi:hypothetical protein